MDDMACPASRWWRRVAVDGRDDGRSSKQATARFCYAARWWLYSQLLNEYRSRVGRRGLSQSEIETVGQQQVLMNERKALDKYCWIEKTTDQLAKAVRKTYKRHKII